MEQLADLAKGPPLSLADLAARVQTPPELIRSWLRQLAQEHKLAGYLQGDGGVFHRLAREPGERAAVCPNCGAAWPSAGPGETSPTLCPQCQSEIFI